MFVQVIEGTVADRQALRDRLDRWEAELKPGATGFLGSTAGVTPGGRAVLLARFESADAARANSDRAEQGEWWAATEGCFDGPVTFAESSDVDTFRAVGSDEAGFVQVMKGSDVDRARVRELDALFEEHGGDFRPDLIGGYRAWTGPDTYVEAAYFTSEAEAREGERQDPPPALAERFGEFRELMEKVEFLDLPDPVLTSGV